MISDEKGVREAKIRGLKNTGKIMLVWYNIYKRGFQVILEFRGTLDVKM